MAKQQTTPKNRRLKPKTGQQAAAARPGSMYDKVIKENLEKSMETIIKDVIGLPIVKTEPLRTKMQHTKERDPDELSLIWLPDGTQRILHAEIHLKDEYAINYRLCEYYVMFKRKKRVPLIIQYIIYIGSEDPKNITGVWETESLIFRYNLIVLKNIPYHIFLEADNAETVVLAILADFHGEEPEVVGKKITNRLGKLSKIHSEKEKFYTQLRVLANARKLQPIIDKIMTNIYKLIDISEDPLFVEGKEEGLEEGIELGKELGKAQGIEVGKAQGIEVGKAQGIEVGKAEGVLEGKIDSIKSLMINTDFDDESIASYLTVPLELVKKTRKNLSKP